MSVRTSTISTLPSSGLALYPCWQDWFPIYTFYLVSIAIIYTLGAVYEIQSFATLTGLHDRLLDRLFPPYQCLSDKTTAFLTATRDRISRQPILNTPHMVYRLPKSHQYIASFPDINDVAEPLRVGQLAKFVRISDLDGQTVWLGISTSRVFSPRSRGSHSPPIFNEDPNVMVGSKAYGAIGRPE